MVLFDKLLALIKRRRTEGHIVMADTARDRCEWARAAHHYSEALSMDVMNADIWLQLGHSFKESGQPEEAETAYRRALALRPTSAEVHLQMGHLYKVVGRLEQSIYAYLNALKSDPYFAPALDELLDAGISAFEIHLALGRVSRKAEPPEPMPAVSFVLDVSDLVHYFHKARFPTGIQRVQMEIALALLRRREDEPVTLGCFTQARSYWHVVPVDLFKALCAFAVSPGSTNDADWRMAKLELLLALGTAEPIVFAPGAILLNLGTSWWLTNYFLQVRYAKKLFDIIYIPFVHDCIPLLAPHHCERKLVQDYLAWIQGVFLHADHYLVNSRSTLADLHRAASRLGYRVGSTNIIELDGRFSVANEEPDEIERRRFLRNHDLDSRPFVLFVSTIESRKNHLFVFRALSDILKERSPEEVPFLVCVGNLGWLYDAALAFLDSNPEVARQVRILRGLSDRELTILYRTCIFTIYPSSYEGWGLPVTESLCFGKVPLISNSSSLPEAGGLFAEYFNLDDENDFKAAFNRLTDEIEYRRERETLIDQHFHPRTWDEIAAQLCSTLPPPRRALGSRRLIFQAEPGTIYSLRRPMKGPHNVVRSGEMFRSGTAWFGADELGDRIRGTSASLAFRLPEELSEPIFIYLLLFGDQGQEHCEEIEFAIVGNSVEIYSGSLSCRQNRILRLQIEPESVERSITIEIVRKLPTATDANFSPRYRSTVGVAAFAYCSSKDINAQIRILNFLMFPDDVAPQFQIST